MGYWRSFTYCNQKFRWWSWTQTAGLVEGGYNGTAAVTEAFEYDGSAWTAGGDINTARFAGGGNGIQTAALVTGGEAPGAGQQDIVESYDGGTQTHTASATTPAFAGYGGGFDVEQFEKNLQGIQHGYYNRLELPNAPGLEAATGTSYDMYHVLASKDGSSSSQIHGVDNLIEINIATTANDADSLIFENLLNAYFTGVFPAVIL